MNVYLAGTYSRPYVLNLTGGVQMDLYLAGGISGNLSAEWRKLLNGAEDEVILGRGASCKEWQFGNRGGADIGVILLLQR